MPDSIDENISFQNLQHAENGKVAQIMLLIQGSASMPTEMKMTEAQMQDLYCPNIQIIVGSYPTQLFNEKGLL